MCAQPGGIQEKAGLNTRKEARIRQKVDKDICKQSYRRIASTRPAKRDSWEKPRTTVLPEILGVTKFWAIDRKSPLLNFGRNKFWAILTCLTCS